MLNKRRLSFPPEFTGSTLLLQQRAEDGSREYFPRCSLNLTAHRSEFIPQTNSLRDRMDEQRDAKGDLAEAIGETSCVCCKGID